MSVKSKRWLLLALVAVGLLVLLSRVDWKLTSHYLKHLGASAPLLLLPYLVVLTCDTLGWRLSFEHPSRLGFVRLWCIRLATEALNSSLPGGIAVGETLKALLLKRACGIAIPEATANVIVSKFALAVAQGVFLVCGVALSAHQLARHSVALIGRPGLEWLGLSIALIFLAALIGLVFITQRAVLSLMLERLRALSGERWRARLTRLETPLAHVDHGLAVVARVPPLQVASSVAAFFAGWVALGFENWLILSLLAPGHVAFTDALSMEAIVSLVRIAFFFVPSALGAQEVSYYAVLTAFDLPEAQALAAAFMIAKRAKEACYIAVGYVLLSFLPASVSEVQTSTA